MLPQKPKRPTKFSLVGRFFFGLTKMINSVDFMPACTIFFRQSFQDLAMRKRYTTSEYKEEQERYQKRQEKKRRNRKEDSEFPNGQPLRLPHKVKVRGKRVYNITAPETFSLIQAPSGVLGFASMISECGRSEHPTPIYCNLEDIKVLTPDAILYFKSQLEAFKEVHPDRKIHGRLPKDKDAANLLIESGFLSSYNMKRSIPPEESHSQNKNILQMENGVHVKSQVAKQAVLFARKHLGLARVETSSTYTTIIELMKNTYQHAYDGNVKYSRRWWLIAVHMPESNLVSFSVLDNGVGIPNTVRKKFWEHFKITLNEDVDYIASALEGGFRTRTGKKHRGNGLPSIFECYQNSEIYNLKVFSNRGFVDYSETTPPKNLDHHFRGALICWDLRRRKL